MKCRCSLALLSLALRALPLDLVDLLSPLALAPFAVAFTAVIEQMQSRITELESASMSMSAGDAASLAVSQGGPDDNAAEADRLRSALAQVEAQSRERLTKAKAVIDDRNARIADLEARLSSGADGNGGSGGDLAAENVRLTCEKWKGEKGGDWMGACCF